MLTWSEKMLASANQFNEKELNNAVCQRQIIYVARVVDAILASTVGFAKSYMAFLLVLGFRASNQYLDFYRPDAVHK